MERTGAGGRAGDRTVAGVGLAATTLLPLEVVTTRDSGELVATREDPRDEMGGSSEPLAANGSSAEKSSSSSSSSTCASFATDPILAVPDLDTTFWGEPPWKQSLLISFAILDIAEFFQLWPAFVPVM